LWLVEGCRKPFNSLVILAVPRNMWHCHYRRVESHIVKTGREPDESKTPLSPL
jgi:hypothetical protein